MPVSQRQIKNLRFDTVTEAEAAGRRNEICYVEETETFYDFLVLGSAYTVDDLIILSTGKGGNTRWIAKAGKYAKVFLQKDTVAPESEGEVTYKTGDKCIYVGVDV